MKLVTLMLNNVTLFQLYFMVYQTNDVKMIVKEFDNLKVDIKVLPKSYEDYISFQVRSLRFLDSYRFLSCSLEVAAKSLKHNDLKIWEKNSKDISNDDFELVK